VSPISTPLGILGLPPAAETSPGFLFVSPHVIFALRVGGVGRDVIMNQRNWIIAAVVVIILIIGYYALRPGAQAPTETATPPATTEQPAQPAPAQ
jgi:hypothetical protein